jgi:hypothetical protein
MLEQASNQHPITIELSTLSDEAVFSCKSLANHHKLAELNTKS